MDEIGELSLALQPKLLRFLENGEFRRVGGVTNLSSDIRIIAATNKDLIRQVEEGKFREDLYYRLNVVHLRIPPLRERREDIPLLFHHFILVACHRYQREVPFPEPAQMNSIMELGIVRQSTLHSPRQNQVLTQ